MFVVCCSATQINSKDPYLLAQLSGLGDCKVARVGRPATDYKLVVRPWESDIRPCISLDSYMYVLLSQAQSTGMHALITLTIFI